MSTKTPHFGLTLPDWEEHVDIDVLNENFSELDGAVANKADLVNGKVPGSQLPDMDFEASGSAAKVQANLTNHENNKSNPHGVTAAQVKADPAGTATNAVNTHNTAAAPHANMNWVNQATLNTHANNKSNPHGVTAAQTGAVPTGRTVNKKALSSDITLTAADVGAEASGASNTAVNSHNTSTTAHANMGWALQTALNTHANNSTSHITGAERTAWNEITKLKNEQIICEYGSYVGTGTEFTMTFEFEPLFGCITMVCITKPTSNEGIYSTTLMNGINYVMSRVAVPNGLGFEPISFSGSSFTIGTTTSTFNQANRTFIYYVLGRRR